MRGASKPRRPGRRSPGEQGGAALAAAPGCEAASDVGKLCEAALKHYCDGGMMEITLKVLQQLRDLHPDCPLPPRYMARLLMHQFLAGPAGILSGAGPACAWLDDAEAAFAFARIAHTLSPGSAACAVLSAAATLDYLYCALEAHSGCVDAATAAKSLAVCRATLTAAVKACQAAAGHPDPPLDEPAITINSASGQRTEDPGYYRAAEQDSVAGPAWGRPYRARNGQLHTMLCFLSGCLTVVRHTRLDEAIRLRCLQAILRQCTLERCYSLRRCLIWWRCIEEPERLPVATFHEIEELKAELLAHVDCVDEVPEPQPPAGLSAIVPVESWSHEGHCGGPAKSVSGSAKTRPPKRHAQQLHGASVAESCQRMAGFWGRLSAERRRRLLTILLAALNAQGINGALRDVRHALRYLKESDNCHAAMWTCYVCDRRWKGEQHFRQHVLACHERLHYLPAAKRGRLPDLLHCKGCNLPVVGELWFHAALKGPISLEEHEGYHVLRLRNDAEAFCAQCHKQL